MQEAYNQQCGHIPDLWDTCIYGTGTLQYAVYTVYTCHRSISRSILLYACKVAETCKTYGGRIRIHKPGIVAPEVVNDTVLSAYCSWLLYSTLLFCVSILNFDHDLFGVLIHFGCNSQKSIRSKRPMICTVVKDE